MGETETGRDICTPAVFGTLLCSPSGVWGSGEPFGGGETRVAVKGTGKALWQCNYVLLFLYPSRAEPFGAKMLWRWRSGDETLLLRRGGEESNWGGDRDTTGGIKKNKHTHTLLLLQQQQQQIRSSGPETKWRGREGRGADSPLLDVVGQRAAGCARHCIVLLSVVLQLR